MVTEPGSSAASTEPSGYSPKERELLSRYFSVVDKRSHADIYLVRGLPHEVAATLNGVYSRSSLSMRDNFLQRLQRGLEESGQNLDQLELPPSEQDLLSPILADRSGKFLKTYAIDHGHNSLREGAVLHLAVENVSQLVTRFCQRERRCSFEESSTRYISFSREAHWRDPDVMAAGGSVRAAYDAVLTETFALYESITTRLVAHLQKSRPLGAGEQSGPYLRAIQAEAFDAARYLLTPAILTKWGFVLDARTLADLVSELLSHPLQEFQIVGQRLREQGELVVKTLLTHAKVNPHTQGLHMALPQLAQELGRAPRHHGERRSHVTLLSYDRDLDNRLVASLLYEYSQRSMADCVRAASSLGRDARARILRSAVDSRGPRDAMPAGIEGTVPFEFELLVDFGAYRDIGRHRKGFQQQQTLTTGHGFLVPPLIVEAGLDTEYREVLDRAADHQDEVAKHFPQAAGYVTPFAFLQRARVIFDPRQLAYFIELRSAPEGHFAYRKIALDMYREVQRVSPLFASLVRAHEGDAFLGRMVAEQTAEERRHKRMKQAGDL